MSNEWRELPNSVVLNIYRSILAALICIQVLWLVAPPYFWNSVNNEDYGAGVNSDVLAALEVLSLALVFVYIFLYVGMLYSKRWARNSVIALSLVTFFSTWIGGISVQSGIEGAVGYMHTLFEGLAVGLAFHPSILGRGK